MKYSRRGADSRLNEVVYRSLLPPSPPSHPPPPPPPLILLVVIVVAAQVVRYTCNYRADFSPRRAAADKVRHHLRTLFVARVYRVSADLARSIPNIARCQKHDRGQSLRSSSRRRTDEISRGRKNTNAQSLVLVLARSSSFIKYPRKTG